MAKKAQAEFIRWFGPLLDALRDLGDSGRPREVSARISKNLDLPDELLDQTLKSGGSKFHNQVAWARQYLVWEGLLDSSKHGTWTLTEKGRNAHLGDKEAREIFLKWVAIHAENRKQKQGAQEAEEEVLPSVANVEDQEDNEKLDLLSTLRSISPTGFEKVCRELLRESGFENVEVTGGSADGGIDGYGTLEINPLVASEFYFNASATRKGIWSLALKLVISGTPCSDVLKRGSSLLHQDLAMQLSRRRAERAHLKSSWWTATNWLKCSRGWNWAYSRGLSMM